jgi:FemAB-related protein (PEP-CTERM system-associated)
MAVKKVRRITPDDYSVWDQYVLSNPDGGPYLFCAWKQAVEQAYGHRTYYLASFAGPAVNGVLPLVLIKHPLGRGRLVSLPFCDYGGLLADSETISTHLLKHATELAIELRSDLEIRNPRSCSALEVRDDFYPGTDKCRMLLKLPESADLLMSGFKSKLRSQIRKPSKEGLRAVLGYTDLLSDFYTVFCRNMRDLGSPVHSRKWIDAVVQAFGSQARVSVVYKDDIPIGGGIVLTSRDTVTIPWASTLRTYNRWSPNMLLYWTFLADAADNGFRFFDFGRSTPGEGTYAFKKQWGAEPAPLFWYKHKTTSSRTGTRHTGFSLQSTGATLWQKLPLVAANFMGPGLRKYIDR